MLSLNAVVPLGKGGVVHRCPCALSFVSGFFSLHVALSHRFLSPCFGQIYSCCRGGVIPALTPECLSAGGTSHRWNRSPQAWRPPHSQKRAYSCGSSREVADDITASCNSLYLRGKGGICCARPAPKTESALFRQTKKGYKYTYVVPRCIFSAFRGLVKNKYVEWASDSSGRCYCSAFRTGRKHGSSSVEPSRLDAVESLVVQPMWVWHGAAFPTLRRRGSWTKFAGRQPAAENRPFDWRIFLLPHVSSWRFPRDRGRRRKEQNKRPSLASLQDACLGRNTSKNVGNDLA